MRVERINYVSEQDEVVDERGTDGVGVTPPALYLDLLRQEDEGQGLTHQVNPGTPG